MTSTAIDKIEILTTSQREEFKFHSEQIKKAITLGQEAKNELVSHMLSVISASPPLWIEHYSSEEEYIKTELNIEVSSFSRLAKANKSYLYLIGNTEDKDEQISLARMRENAYRELRQIATDNKPILKIKGEDDNHYRERVLEKEKNDLKEIQNLWFEIYPKIKHFKERSGTGAYTNGGYSITAKDITETCLIVQKIFEIPKLLNEGILPSEISVGSIGGEDLSLQEIIDKSSSNFVQILDVVTQLGVSESLSEKLHRQQNHIRESLEKKYIYDSYNGTLNYENGKLFIENQYGKFDLINEWSDLLSKETVISIRRSKYQQ